MTAYFRRGMCAAVLIVSATQMAQADVTAQDIWSDWKNYMTSVGYDVTGTESTSGGTLTVSDLTMSMKMPQNEGAVSIDMSTLVFTGNSDGTVAVTMPGTVPMQISGQEDGETFDVTFNLSQSGNSMIVSGAPVNMNYNYTASQVNLVLASLLVDGKPMPADLARVNVTLTNVISSTTMKLADMRDYSQRMSADSLSYDAAFSDPDSDEGGVFNGSVIGLSFQGSGMIPLEMNPEDLPAMLAAGFAFSGAFEYASGNSSMNAKGGGDEFSFTGSSQGGKLGVAMDAAHVAYDVLQKGTSIEVITNQLPFPVSMQMAESRLLLDMPVTASDEQQGFSLIVKLREFTMSDMIWSMIDPGKVLPRDPATIVMDLSGKGKVLADILDPKVAESLDSPPGELHALEINELLVSAAGTRLSGTGSFTFDNSDLASFDGMPAPTGVANLELVGANGLMDKLIQMGLMSDNDAMGARMMMGMLAVPGAGEDTLNSKIEINDEGHIMANGQRIK